MSSSQPGIFAQGTRSHHYLEYDVRAESDASADDLRAAIGSLREPSVTAGGANIVLAFSRRLWARLCPEDGVPTGLRDFEPVAGRARTAAATQHDLWLWTHGANSDVVVDVARASTFALGPVATLAHEQPAFVYKESRDFFGFIDGTENPPVWEGHLVTQIPASRPGAGGSYVLTMKWVHDLGTFHALAERDQEDVIGRTKDDSEELPDDVRPDTAHISRVVIEDDDGEELEIYRRSTPFGSVREQGLQFVAFAKDIGIYDAMLARMFGTSGDGLHDRLTEFSNPVRGAYYFAPSLEQLHEVLGPL